MHLGNAYFSSKCWEKQHGFRVKAVAFPPELQGQIQAATTSLCAVLLGPVKALIP